MIKTFHSNGKLLLTGEYVVLDGATALAIPTRQGQSLTIQASEKKEIQWNSLDENGAIWFEDSFNLENLNGDNPNSSISNTLSKILRETKKLNPNFLSETKGIQVQTNLEFPRSWGLGTSSTLINNIAQWAKVDGFKLLANSFGGSGYDIAAAQNDVPILYELKYGKPQYQEVELSWKFKESIFFVHLNQKQDSKEGIARYRNVKISHRTIEQISEISAELLLCKSLSNFEQLLNLHEEIISETIKLPTLKKQFFNDYHKTIKSLGAWGGDFILVTGTVSDMQYFRNKGFETIVPFEKMIR